MLKELRVQKVLKEVKEHRGTKVLLVRQGILDHKGRRDLKVIKELKDLGVRKEHRVHKVHKDQLALPVI